MSVSNLKLQTSGSRLVDQVAALKTENAALEARQAASSTPAGKTTIKSQAAKDEGTETSENDSAVAARLRLQLAEALRARGQFQSRLQAAETELTRLQAKTAADTKTLQTLAADHRALGIKLRDREEELRVKNKLVADVQDELAVLNMQLDMVEKRRAEKEAENNQLVERFMKRVGQEADAMNLANEPLFSKKRSG